MFERVVLELELDEHKKKGVLFCSILFQELFLDAIHKIRVNKSLLASSWTTLMTLEEEFNVICFIDNSPCAHMVETGNWYWHSHDKLDDRHVGSDKRRKGLGYVELGREFDLSAPG